MSMAVLATWFSAVGTVGAFVTGGGVLWREIDRDHDRANQETRRQAEQVAAWVVGGDDSQVDFVADNSSDLPVYDVVIISDVLSPRSPVNVDMGMIQAGSQSKISFEGKEKLGGLSAAHPVPVAFTDHKGQHWLRDGLGLLYPGTRDLLDKLEFPNGIVGGWRKAREI